MLVTNHENAWKVLLRQSVGKLGFSRVSVHKDPPCVLKVDVKKNLVVDVAQSGDGSCSIRVDAALVF